ncbi:uncharacterized protein [Diadema setosum]|uniref:uncharacterized protein n=1 Tax=Diadema setosum TaxID=31175 RepID=UPI003B3BDEA2
MASSSTADVSDSDLGSEYSCSYIVYSDVTFHEESEDDILLYRVVPEIDASEMTEAGPDEAAGPAVREEGRLGNSLRINMAPHRTMKSKGPGCQFLHRINEERYKILLQLVEGTFHVPKAQMTRLQKNVRRQYQRRKADLHVLDGKLYFQGREVLPTPTAPRAIKQMMNENPRCGGRSNWERVNRDKAGVTLRDFELNLARINMAPHRTMKSKGSGCQFLHRINEERYKILLQLVEGTFHVPKAQMTRLQKNVRRQYQRRKADLHVLDGKLYFQGREVLTTSTAPRAIKQMLNENPRCGSRSNWEQVNRDKAGVTLRDFELSLARINTAPHRTMKSKGSGCQFLHRINEERYKILLQLVEGTFHVPKAQMTRLQKNVRRQYQRRKADLHVLDGKLYFQGREVLPTPTAPRAIKQMLNENPRCGGRSNWEQVNRDKAGVTLRDFELNLARINTAPHRTMKSKGSGCQFLHRINEERYKILLQLVEGTFHVPKAQMTRLQKNVRRQYQRRKADLHVLDGKLYFQGREVLPTPTAPRAIKQMLNENPRCGGRSNWEQVNRDKAGVTLRDFELSLARINTAPHRTMKSKGPGCQFLHKINEERYKILLQLVEGTFHVPKAQMTRLQKNVRRQYQRRKADLHVLDGKLYFQGREVLTTSTAPRAIKQMLNENPRCGSRSNWEQVNRDKAGVTLMDVKKMLSKSRQYQHHRPLLKIKVPPKQINSRNVNEIVKTKTE